jgi:2-keto-4-pentenoate hydratase/2-oxohepta-3-ene-1,7-dioic acid hydratase in catechol pathway
MMRLANLDGRATLLTGAGTGVDIATASGEHFGPGIAALYPKWDELREWAADPPASHPMPSRAKVGAPSPAPAQVFAIGLNYRDHAAESGMDVPAIPATFTKFPACLTGDDAEVALPSGQVDWEVELVVVIGTPAHRVTATNGWRHVAGLTVGQDLSERHVQFAAGGQFSLGKSYPGFGPLGPLLVTPDELSDPDDLAIGCSVNGEEVQKSRTSELVFGVARLVAELSAIVPLLPGDVIFTGTPAGVGFTRRPARFLRPGDVITSTIEGIGTLTTRCAGTSSPS